MIDLGKENLKLLLQNYISYCSSKPKNNLIDDIDVLSLQINFKKIPITGKPFRNLPYSYSKDLKTCMIVKNLKKRDSDDKKFNEEDDIHDVHFWKRKLENDCNFSITKILTFHQLRTSYLSYESRNKLATSFDIFFADHRLMDYFPRILGSPFIKRKKWPLGIKLKQNKISTKINVFYKTFCEIRGHGSCCELPFAHSTMPLSEIIKNLLKCLKMLDIKIPGTSTNIQSIYLKSRLCSNDKSNNIKKIPLSVPLYLDIGNPNSLAIPSKTNDEVNEINHYEEITTLPDGVGIKISPNGNVIIKKLDKIQCGRIRIKKLKKKIESNQKSRENVSIKNVHDKEQVLLEPKFSQEKDAIENENILDKILPTSDIKQNKNLQKEDSFNEKTKVGLNDSNHKKASKKKFPKIVITPIELKNSNAKRKLKEILELKNVTESNSHEQYIYTTPRITKSKPKLPLQLTMTLRKRNKELYQ